MSDVAFRLVCVLFAAALVAFATSSLSGESPPTTAGYTVAGPGR